MVINPNRLQDVSNMWRKKNKQKGNFFKVLEVGFFFFFSNLCVKLQMVSVKAVKTIEHMA